MEVICCFCGESLNRDRATELAVCPAGAKDEVQGMYCHASCLIERLTPGFVVLPDLEAMGPER